MSLDLHFSRLPKGVDVRKIGETKYWEYPDAVSAWEGDTTFAVERVIPILGLFIDGIGVPSTNLYKYPEGGYSISARCGSAGEVITKLEKQQIKYRLN